MAKGLKVSGLLVAVTLVFMALASWSPATAAAAFGTKAKYAVLMDYETGDVLYQKDADTPTEPASLAKLMTLAVVFEDLKSGQISLNDKFFISEHAWRKGGAASGSSTMFAKLHSQVPVIDLIRSVIIQSGNDAAIALAEGIAGSEATFANIENQLAAKIGLTESHFTDASGLPEPGMHVTARDLAILARYLIKNYPEYYPIFGESEFTWNKIKQRNRNTLVTMDIGVDGLKTGHSDETGYGSVISSVVDGRRLIGVLLGMNSESERTEEGRKLLNWGQRSFERMSLFPQGKIVGYADVYGGAQSKVGLVGKGDIDFFMPKGTSDCPQARIVYTGPLRPPVSKGDKVGVLNVTCHGDLVRNVPLFAARTVESGGFMDKAMAALKQLVLGWI